MTLWKRYLWKRLLTSFLLLLSAIFFMFIAIDLSIQGNKFFSYETSLLTLLKNYLYQFSLYFDLFGSVAFLLAALKVLIYSNVHHELTALQMGGLSKQKLLSPFFILAIILTLLSYSNSQWIIPKTATQLDLFKKSHSSKKKKARNLFSLPLEDGSVLVYQRFDPELSELFDLYWIVSFDDIWYMQRYYVSSQIAEDLEHFVHMKKENSFPKQHPFIIPCDHNLLLQPLIPIEHRPLFHLVHQAFQSTQQKNAILSHLYYKLLLGWIPPLMVLAITPFAFSFSRNRSNLLFVACSLFLFIGFMTLLNGMLILAENQVLHPLIAIGSPIALTFTTFFLIYGRRNR